MKREDLVRVLKAMKVPEIPPRGKNLLIRCPLAPWFHNNKVDHNPSLSILVDPDGPSLFQCFACHRKGPLSYLVALYDRKSGGVLGAIVDEVQKMEDGDAAAKCDRIIESAYGVTTYGSLFDQKDEESDPTVVWSEKELARFSKELPDWIYNRGVSQAVCEKFGVLWDPKDKRILFPVRRRPDSALVGLSKRTIVPGVEPRYKDGWGFHKGKFLFGENFVDPKGAPLIVAEGFIDVLHLYTLGFTNAIACMGTQVTTDQIERIRSWSMPVIIAMDGDPAGRQATRLLMKELAGRQPVFVATLPDGRDPGDLSFDEMRTIVDNAVFVVETVVE